MTSKDFKIRTRNFALECVRLVESLPKTNTAFRLGDQLLRCGTSVGANYRAACRAKSAADFISKMGTVEEEADECIYWLELLIEAKHLLPNHAKLLLNEANQIVAMTVASINTARTNSRPSKNNPKSAIRNPQSARPQSTRAGVV